MQLKLGMFIQPLSELARSLCCAKWGWKAFRDKLPSDVWYSLLLLQLQARNQLHTRVFGWALLFTSFFSSCYSTQAVATAAGGTKPLHTLSSFPYASEWGHWLISRWQQIKARLTSWKQEISPTRGVFVIKMLMAVKQDEFNPVQELLHERDFCILQISTHIFSPLNLVLALLVSKIRSSA